MMPDTVFWLKAAGATMGSSIAIVFKPGGDRWFRLFQRFVIGAILGFISAPVILDYLGWEHGADHWLAAATIGGLLGYLMLQLIFSGDLLNLIRHKTGNKP